jgi:hypothetical protein
MKHTNIALSVAQKQTAAMLIATTLMWAIGAPLLMVSRADAAQLGSISDTLSTSAKGVVANHTIKFTTPSTGAMTAGQTIFLNFRAGVASTTFDVPLGLTYADLDVSVNAVDQTLAASQSGATWGVNVDDAADTITLTVGSGGVPTTTPVVIKIGTNAAGGVHQIVNPNPSTAAGVGTSYPIIITTPSNAGTTRVAIIDQVTMTASVDTTLTFTIQGVASSTTINGVSTFASSTATSMAFGTLSPNVPKVLGQKLTVTTNAANGFGVTVVQDQNMLSASGADIDLFVNGDATTTPIAWQAPSANITNENTWGHYGITSDDATLSTGDPFGATSSLAYFSGHFASSTPLEVFYHNGPAYGSVAGKSTADIAVKIEISDLQEAANDYSNTLTYVCTPIF